MAARRTVGRYTEIPYEQMSPEHQEGYRAMMEARGAVPLGPRTMWVHNPKLAKVIGPYGAHFQPGRFSLTLIEREIAVLVITSKYRAAYPISIHERSGKHAGLSSDRVEAIISGFQTSFSDEREQVVYEMAQALANARWISRGLYDRAVKALDHVGITDVITLMGHYSSVAMTLSFYDVPGQAADVER